MLEFDLVDNGTLDTVIEVHCTECDRTWEEVFSQEYASEFRDSDTGELDMDAFIDGYDVTCECEY